jgi:hypothetical protein
VDYERGLKRRLADPATGTLACGQRIYPCLPNRSKDRAWQLQGCIRLGSFPDALPLTALHQKRSSPQIALRAGIRKRLHRDNARRGKMLHVPASSRPSGPCPSYPLTPRWANLHLSDQQNSCCLALFAPLRMPAFVHCRSGSNGPARNLFPRDPRRQNCWSHIIVSRLISELCSILTGSTHRNTRSARCEFGRMHQGAFGCRRIHESFAKA